MDTEIQARLQKMVTRDRNGTAALILLQRLCLFKQKFKGTATAALAADCLTREQRKSAFASLRSWGFLQRSRYRIYWIEDAVREIIAPDFRGIEQLYRYYASHQKVLKQKTDRLDEWFKLEPIINIQALHWGFDNNVEPENAVDLFFSFEYYMSGTLYEQETRSLLKKASQASDHMVVLQKRAKVSSSIGRAANHLQAYDIGYKACKQAIDLYGLLGDTYQQILTTATLGELAYGNQDYEQARTCCDEVLNYYLKEEEDPLRRMWALSMFLRALSSLRDVAAKQDDHETVTHAFQQSLDRLPSLSQWQQVEELYQLGVQAHRLRKFEMARKFYAWSLSIIQGDQNSLRALEKWAELEYDTGNLATARSLGWLAILTAEQIIDRNATSTNETYYEQTEKLIIELRQKYGLTNTQETT